MFFKKKYKSLTESECIEKAKQDERYFAPLYEKHFEMVFKFVFKRVDGNEDLAGDLTQLTFLKAMLKIKQYEDRGFQFSSWLIRIAINEINQHFRSKKVNFTVSVGESEMKQVFNVMHENEEEISEKEEDLEKLVKKINTLEEDQREIIEMRFFDGLSFKEIAEIIDTTEANAKMKVYRILEKVKKSW